MSELLHAATDSYLHPSLALALHSGNANLRQSVELLYRCALVAEAGGFLLFASCIPYVASALGRHLGDLMHGISSLHKTVHTRLRSTSRSSGRVADGDESAECPICMAQFSGGNIIHLRCQHEFHAHCITTWLHYANPCPLCRKEVNAQDIPGNGGFHS